MQLQIVAISSKFTIKSVFVSSSPVHRRRKQICGVEAMLHRAKRGEKNVK